MARPVLVPTPSEFFLKTSLYEWFDVEPRRLLELEYYPGSLDAYCPKCQRHSVFMPSREGLPLVESKEDKQVTSPDSLGVMLEYANAQFFVVHPKESAKPIEVSQYHQWAHVQTVVFHCSRNIAHEMFFVLQVRDGLVQKIGQEPSLAALQLGDIKDYRKLLGDQATEFTKAVGLYAHGVGVGSFVYLRRIFESLIEDAHRAQKAEQGWDEGEFQRSRMDQRIGLLSSKLPQLLVENAVIYSILSKGIHDLEEDDCLRYFNVVKTGIELILHAKIAQAEAEKKQKDTGNAIAQLQGDLKRRASSGAL